MKADLFEAPDYYLLDDLLSEEHKLVRSAARDWVKRDVSPIMHNVQNFQLKLLEV
jgi:glutaryl-CoA dehydrogenase